MAKIVQESNFNRKTHRLTIPLLIEIAGTVHKCADWSVDGVGLSGLTQSYKIGEFIDAKLILPITDSTLSIQVKLECKNHNENRVGFAFYQLPSNHKRLLRHFVEQAVEGKLDNIEDFLAIAAAPNVASPINQALNLSDVDTLALKRKFSVRSKLFIGFAILFLVVLMTALYFQLNYRVKGNAIVLGNTLEVAAPIDGIVRRVLISEGAQINQNQHIATLENTTVNASISALNNTIAQLANSLSEVSQPSDSNTLADAKRLLKKLAQIEQRDLTAYQQGQSLFADNAITQYDLSQLERRWLASSLAYNKEALRQKEAQAQFERAQQNTQSLQKQLVEKRQQLKELELSKFSKVYAPGSGAVYSVTHAANTQIKKDQVITLITTDSSPYLLLPVTQAQLLALYMGIEAKIHIPTEKRVVSAKVAALTPPLLTAYESNAFPLNPNLNYVRLQFDKPIRLPPFSHVEVWIDTFELF